MRAIIITAAALALLCGCTTPEQRAERDRAKCGGYGFTPGTDGFANCLMGMDRARWAALAAMSSDGAVRRPVTCNTFGTMTSCY